jgi:heterodisulfide reductase subunit B
LIISAEHNAGQEIVATYPLCKANVEIYQDNINQTYGTKFKMPVVYYSTLMSVAFGRSAADTALNGQVIQAKQLEEIAK